MASAEDLFGLMTDEKRIPSWTRAPAQVNRLLPSFSLLFSPFFNHSWGFTYILQSSAIPDTEYSLFGGGVKGTYVSLLPPKEIKQTWSLQSPTWPSGRYKKFKNVFFCLDLWVGELMCLGFECDRTFCDAYDDF